MSLLLSDGIGVAAGIILAIPPIRDQYGRWQERRQKRKGSDSLPKMRNLLANSLKEKREIFNGYDTILLILGSVFLALSFGLKYWDL